MLDSDCCCARCRAFDSVWTVEQLLYFFNDCCKSLFDILYLLYAFAALVCVDQ